MATSAPGILLGMVRAKSGWQTRCWSSWALNPQPCARLDGPDFRLPGSNSGDKEAAGVGLGNFLARHSRGFDHPGSRSARNLTAAAREGELDPVIRRHGDGTCHAGSSPAVPRTTLC